jgi:hypothetical protein
VCPLLLRASHGATSIADARCSSLLIHITHPPYPRHVASQGRSSRRRRRTAGGPPAAAGRPTSSGSARSPLQHPRVYWLVPDMGSAGPVSRAVRYATARGGWSTVRLLLIGARACAHVCCAYLPLGRSGLSVWSTCGRACNVSGGGCRGRQRLTVGRLVRGGSIATREKRWYLQVVVLRCPRVDSLTLCRLLLTLSCLAYKCVHSPSSLVGIRKQQVHAMSLRRP